MSRVIVKNGTPTTAESLCKSCLHALVRTGFAESQEETICNAGYEMAMQIRYPIAKCTQYLNKAQPTLYSMEKIAWILVTNESTKQVGFINNKEFRKIEGENAPIVPLTT
jgi:hypothetical protein